jgi:hypothetical protein
MDKIVYIMYTTNTERFREYAQCLFEMVEGRSSTIQSRTRKKSIQTHPIPRHTHGRSANQTGR